VDLPLFFTLPLIGGYAFVTGFFALRWRSARQDAQRLYYRAAVWGGVLTLVAASLHLLLLLWPAYRHGYDWLDVGFLQPLLTVKDPLPAASTLIRSHVALVCVYALLFGVSATLWGRALLWIASRFDVRLSVMANLNAITDPLESLLARSLLNGEAIQVTLSTGKVYVGYVLEAADPDLPTKFIRMQPLMSGQRNADGQVEYTTFYDQILAEFEANPETQSAVASFQQVIPVDKVVTLSGFNLDAYVHFLAESEGRPGDAPKEPGSIAGPLAAAPWLLAAAFVLARLIR
jgi:hypothetical protein